jgi:hypothetical protein
MSSVFDLIFPDEIKLPVSNIQVLIDSYRIRQRTGALRLGYPSGKQLCFLFKRGEALNTYLTMSGTWESMAYDRAVEWMSSEGSAYTKSVSLSSFGLLMTKLLIQSTDKTDEEVVRRGELSECLSRIRKKNDVALVHLEWTNATGVIFFEHGAIPSLHFVAKDVFLDESGSYSILSEWDAPQCKVSLFLPDPRIDAWREYLLRSAFARICEGQISRFEILTGRALSDSLVRLVAVFAARQGLDISIMARKLEDREAFSSSQEAALRYGQLLGEMFKHFSSVIGSRLHVSALREIVKGLPQLEYQILRDYELLPQGYLYE